MERMSQSLGNLDITHSINIIRNKWNSVRKRILPSRKGRGEDDVSQRAEDTDLRVKYAAPGNRTVFEEVTKDRMFFIVFF